MGFLAFAQVVLRRWWLLPLLAVLGLGLAYAWSVNSPKQYESVVTLQLNPAARSAFLPYTGDARGDPNPVSTLAASYAEVLRSRRFGQLLVQRLNLMTTPEAIARATNARLIPNTNILRLSVSWDNPWEAQQLAQQIAETFIAENLRRQETEPGDQSRLADMEDAARSYRARLTVLRQQRGQLDHSVADGDINRLTELNNLDIRIAALETSRVNLLVEINRARSAIDTASILDNAAPARAAGPVTLSQALLIGLLGGLALAVALARFIEEIDDRLRTPLDVGAATGSGPLATVGRIGTRNWPAPLRESRLVTLHAPRSGTAEAFRTLLTNVRFAASEHPLRKLVITSPGPGEGKSLLASNLAVALAQAGRRVLLVDGDLRRPSIHSVFRLGMEPGLIEALLEAVESHGREGSQVGASQCELGTAVASVATGLENLSVLPAGHIPDNPSAALASAAVGRLLDQLASSWDFVVIDSAPVGPISDTLLLAAHADAVLVVARAGRTRRPDLQSSLEALAQTGRPVLGVVLNDLRLGPLERYAGYGYYYYGKHHHYYGAGEDAWEQPRNGRPHASANAAQDGRNQAPPA